MESLNGKTMTKEELNPEKELSELFGSYKAEWLRERIYEFYTEPSYFPSLKTPRPCILIGGRGTGKTTVLKSMSYEGQFAVTGKNPNKIPDFDFYGLYYRVDTNRVTAFKGEELSQERWNKVFAHYFNLLICGEILQFLKWYKSNCPDSPTLSTDQSTLIATSLNIDNTSSSNNLADQVVNEQVRFEAYINNIADNDKYPLSMQGAPIDNLFKAVLSLPQFKAKSFFILIDEYENLEDYQQQVVNTLVKHSSGNYVYKIGVRELGLRQRTTLNPNEQLIHPADYVRINITEELNPQVFAGFVSNVINSRTRSLNKKGLEIATIKNLLPGISDEEEVLLLDGENGLASVAAKILEANIPSEDLEELKNLSLLEKYFLEFWSRAKDINIKEVWAEHQNDKKAWNTRYENYKHALLFTVKVGKPGIRKYYAGFDVFIHLAASNVRYFLELVDQSLLLHVKKNNPLSQPISPENQTRVAQEVGRKNLSELEGLSVDGAQLTKLLLGLGRVFGWMAADLLGHAPEVNQFHLSSDEREEASSADQAKEAEKLLKSAIMHLALLRFPGSKLLDRTDTRAYDYMLHPIFSAFFVLSYRRKRKMHISSHQLLALISNNKTGIRDILTSQKRDTEESDISLPEQLLLFEPYFKS